MEAVEVKSKGLQKINISSLRGINEGKGGWETIEIASEGQDGKYETIFQILDTLLRRDVEPCDIQLETPGDKRGESKQKDWRPREAVYYSQ